MFCTKNKQNYLLRNTKNKALKFSNYSLTSKKCAALLPRYAQVLWLYIEFEMTPIHLTLEILPLRTSLQIGIQDVRAYKGPAARGPALSHRIWDGSCPADRHPA